MPTASESREAFPVQAVEPESSKGGGDRVASVVAMEELWQAHRVGGDPSAREALILQYVPFVKYLAGRLSVALHPVLDLEDLVSAGIMGLIKAVEHFDPSRGAPFESYASTRIRGAILDHIRSLDVISRKARQRAREIEKTMASLQSELGRLPTDDELAEQMGLDLETYCKSLAQSAPAVASLDWLVSREDSEESNLLSTLVDTESPDPVSVAERRGLLDALAEAISNLDERDRLILALYYKEELTMKEISQVMGVSESRVCQLHARALLRLRAQLSRWEGSEENPVPARQPSGGQR